MRVSNANAAAAEALVVAGYDVAGEVRSDGDPMKGVSFLLFSAIVKKEVTSIYIFFSYCTILKGFCFDMTHFS